MNTSRESLSPARTGEMLDGDLGMMNRLHEVGSSGSSTSPSLIERVKAQDQDAWRRLVRLYGPLVDFWIRRTGLLQPADANDLFQDVFLAVARAVGRFSKDRPGDSFRGWLRTITRSKVADHHRQRGFEFRAAGGSDAQQRFEELADSPPDETDESNEICALRFRAVEMLRGQFEEKTWRAFWRVTVEGHAVKDVASDLRVTPSAVRLAKSRVLRRLREELRGLES